MGGETAPAVPESRPSDLLLRSAHRAGDLQPWCVLSTVAAGARVGWGGTRTGVECLGPTWVRPATPQEGCGVFRAHLGAANNSTGLRLDDDGVDLDELTDEAEHRHAQ
jgi:hypothetical protein